MHSPGIPPDRIDSENSLDSGFAILTIDSFKTLFGMPSGPGAECSFSVSIVFRTLSSLNSTVSKLGPSILSLCGTSPLAFVNTDA